VLQEISTGERNLLRPELQSNIARGCVDDAGGRGLRLEVVDGGHFGGDLQFNEALGRSVVVVVEVESFMHAAESFAGFVIRLSDAWSRACPSPLPKVHHVKSGRCMHALEVAMISEICGLSREYIIDQPENVSEEESI
jgi:hypothetical protein